MEELIKVVWNNQPVLTSQQLAELYKCDVNNISKNFTRHKDQFVEGEHYFKLEGGALRDFKKQTTGNLSAPSPYVAVVYLWTKAGCLCHCKLLGTQVAWEVFGKLAVEYFGGEPMVEVKPQGSKVVFVDGNNVAQFNAEDVDKGKKSILTEEHKRRIVNQCLQWNDVCKEAFRMEITPLELSVPKIACVYAMEMSGGDVVKIGVTTNLDQRIKGVNGFFNVFRVHSTGFAPRSFMYGVEKKCHAAFAERRIRGEYFAISFKEAVAELDSHAEEIAAALHEADQEFLAELDYYFNEFLPEYEKIKASPDSSIQNKQMAFDLSDKTIPDKEPSEMACVYAFDTDKNLVKIGHTGDIADRIKRVQRQYGLKVTREHHTELMPRNKARDIEMRMHKRFSKNKAEGEFYAAGFEEVVTLLDKCSESVEINLFEEVTTHELITDFERGKELVKLVAVAGESPLKEQLIRHSANLLIGKNIF